MKIKLNANDKFAVSSDYRNLQPNHKYLATISYSGIQGNPYGGYFGVILFDKNYNEVDRKIQWLNDFSGESKKIQLVFTTNDQTNFGALIYRINDEVPINSIAEYDLSELDNIALEPTQFTDNFTLPEIQENLDFEISSFEELSSEDELYLEKNLVWIFAFPRSGTQWLGTQLLTHDTVLSRGPSIGLTLGATHSGFQNDSIRLVDFRSNEIDYFLSKPFTSIWKFFMRKFILNRLNSQFHNLKQKIIIPDPEGSFGCDFIAKSLPDSKIIILLRDGRDVVDSIIDAGKPNSWYVKSRGVDPITPETRIPRIKTVSRNWVKQIQLFTIIKQFHDPNLVLEIKYEDLLKNTSYELKKIYDFIGIDIPEDKLNKIIQKYSFENISSDSKGPSKVTRSATPGKWKENFSEEEQKIMQDIMGKTLFDLGYLD